MYKYQKTSKVYIPKKRGMSRKKFDKNWFGNGQLKCEQCAAETAMFRDRFHQTLCDKCYWKFLKDIKGEY